MGQLTAPLNQSSSQSRKVLMLSGKDYKLCLLVVSHHNEMNILVHFYNQVFR